MFKNVIIYCPYCNKKIQKNQCESDTHLLSGISNDSSWYLHDRINTIQVGKSISNPYYYFFTDVKPRYFGSLNPFLIEDSINVIQRILKFKAFI